MIRTTLLSVWFCLAVSNFGFAQNAPQPSGDERRWIAEHPEALQALGSLPREDLAKFLQTYQDLTPEEQAKLRDHAGEMQQLSPTERSWAIQNPDAMRQLGAMPEEQRKKFVDEYRKLTPEEKEKLRANADEIRKMSPEEQKWALDHPDAVRELGSVPDGDRKQMLDAYRNLSPEAQGIVRERMGGGR